MNYITIVRNAIGRTLAENKKPDFSVSDWDFIFESFRCLEKVVDAVNNNEYPEYLEDDVINAIQTFEATTKRDFIKRGGKL